MLVNLNPQINQYIILLLELCPHLWRFLPFLPPQAWNKLRSENVVYWYVQNSFLSLFFFLFSICTYHGIWNPFFSIWKAQFSIKTIFLVRFKFSFLQLLKHSFSSICWSNMRLVPITQGYPKHHQKFSNRSLIWTIAQISPTNARNK